MVLGAENVSRIKLFTEDGDACALHKNFKCQISNVKFPINLLDIGIYLKLVLFDILAQRASVVGERFACSEAVS